MNKHVDSSLADSSLVPPNGLAGYGRSTAIKDARELLKAKNNKIRIYSYPRVSERWS